MNKKELRSYLRSLHEGSVVRNAQSQQMCRHILQSDVYRQARVIAGYMPMAHDADVLPVLQDALQSGKQLALPLCGEPPCMTLRLISSLDGLRPGRFGLPEPDDHAPIPMPEEIDLLLIPLEGIDQNGYRLGKGGGYYDCLLPQCRGYTLGCALKWQWVKRVPRDAWDVPLQAVADHRGIHEFNNSALMRKDAYHGKEETDD